jgi:excisionase family DNA binding protein
MDRFARREQMSEKLLLRVSELADAIGCSKSKAYELVGKGLIPSVRIGGLLRVPADALRKMIEDRASGSASAR